MKMKILLLALLTFPLLAESEKDLREQLAQARVALAKSQAALLQESRDRKAVVTAAGKATRAISQGEINSEHRHLVSEQENAANLAKAKQEVIDAAKVQSDTLKAQTEAIRQLTEKGNQTSLTALITSIGTFLVVLIGLVAKHIADGREHRWKQEEFNRAEVRHTETLNKVEVVRQDVNGKSDDLLKLTGDAREAIGKLAGAAEEKAKRVGTWLDT